MAFCLSKLSREGMHPDLSSVAERNPDPTTARGWSLPTVQRSRTLIESPSRPCEHAELASLSSFLADLERLILRQLAIEAELEDLRLSISGAAPDRYKQRRDEI